MQNFEDKVAVVTGAASGIGAGLARAFAREGAHVVLADARDPEPVAPELRSAGGRALAASVDVTSRQAMESLAERVHAEFGRVDVLCNNAGVVVFGSLLEVSEQDWDWIMAVNVRGVINGVAAFVPRMIARGGEAHVVITASGAGLSASAVLPLGAYTTSKYAVVGFGETLRLELEPHGIGVTILCPGSVQTGIHETARYSQSTAHLKPQTAGAPTPSREGVRRMQPAQVAALVLDGIRSNQLYVMSHPEGRPNVEARFEAIAGAFDRAASLMA
jgi:NAD(P)-dependent dehydrogenase (short-subunit alcohol dehydrogenase family)